MKDNTSLSAVSAVGGPLYSMPIALWKAATFTRAYVPMTQARRTGPYLKKHDLRLALKTEVSVALRFHRFRTECGSSSISFLRSVLSLTQ